MAETQAMKGAELASMLKSSIRFKSSNGAQSPGLRLNDEQINWCQDAKLGLFIYWGLYAIPGRGDWVMHNEHIPAGWISKSSAAGQPIIRSPRSTI